MGLPVSLKLLLAVCALLGLGLPLFSWEMTIPEPRLRRPIELRASPPELLPARFAIPTNASPPRRHKRIASW